MALLTLCYALLRFAMLCYALLCFAMLCFAMLCFATSQSSCVRGFPKLYPHSPSSRCAVSLDYSYALFIQQLLFNRFQKYGITVDSISIVSLVKTSSSERFQHLVTCFKRWTRANWSIFGRCENVRLCETLWDSVRPFANAYCFIWLPEIIAIASHLHGSSRGKELELLAWEPSEAWLHDNNDMFCKKIGV